jgi:hypothetical protein
MADLTPEERLWEATREALRAPKARVALILRLSSLAPPAPRPHHRRIAHAILEDAGQRHDGRVFVLSNGDAVLLCRMPACVPPSAASTHPGSLPQILARLFRVDVPNPASLVTLWTLERGGDVLLAYATQARSIHRPAAVSTARMRVSV